MKTFTTTATVGFLALLVLISSSAEAQNSQAGPSSVGVSNISLVLHPRLTVNRGTPVTEATKHPVSVTSNFEGGYEIQRIDLGQLDALQRQPSQKTPRKADRQKFAYVVVPKAE